MESTTIYHLASSLRRIAVELSQIEFWLEFPELQSVRIDVEAIELGDAEFTVERHLTGVTFVSPVARSTLSLRLLGHSDDSPESEFIRECLEWAALEALQLTNPEKEELFERPSSSAIRERQNGLTSEFLSLSHTFSAIVDSLGQRFRQGAAAPAVVAVLASSNAQTQHPAALPLPAHRWQRSSGYIFGEKMQN